MTLVALTTRPSLVRRIMLTLLLTILITSIGLLEPAYSVSRYKWVKSITVIVPAVEETPQGLTGVASTLTVTVAWPGTGEVYISTSPLADLDTQASGRLAILVASLLAGVDYHDYDFFIKYNTTTLFIGGPSASGATAVAALAALSNITLPRNFSMTGMIGPDGSLNPVGGVSEKLKAAASVGIKTFIIPLGQGVVVDEATGRRVNVHELGSKLGVRVLEAATIADVIQAITGLKLYAARPLALSYPSWLSTELDRTIRGFEDLAKSNVTYIERNLDRLKGTSYYQVVSRELSRVKQLLDEARKLEESGLLYSAASRTFMASWHATYAAELLHSLVSDEPLTVMANTISKYLTAARNMIRIVEKKYRDYVAARNITDLGLQLAVTVYDRMDSAKHLIEEASTATDPLEALQAAIIAYYRALTAIQWVSLLQSTAERGLGSPLDWRALRDSVNDFIQFAEATLAYLHSLGMGVDLSSIDKARELLSGGDPVSASSIAINSLAYAISSLHMIFNTLQQRLLPTINATKLLIARVAGMGLSPILPMLYIEYAGQLERTSINDAISLYATASSYALLLYMARPSSSHAGISLSPVAKPSPSLTSTTTKGSETSSSPSSTNIIPARTRQQPIMVSTTTKTVTSILTKTVIRETSSPTTWLYPLIAIVLVVLAFIVVCRASRG